MNIKKMKQTLTKIIGGIVTATALAGCTPSTDYSVSPNVTAVSESGYSQRVEQERIYSFSQWRRDNPKKWEEMDKKSREVLNLVYTRGEEIYKKMDLKDRKEIDKICLGDLSKDEKNLYKKLDQEIEWDLIDENGKTSKENGIYIHILKKIGEPFGSFGGSIFSF